MTGNQKNRPVMAWVPIGTLFIDKRYQRSAESRKSRKVIADIATDFSWAKCQPLTVVHVKSRDMYAVIDGQHRFEAAKELKLTELPCYIVSDCETEEQAAFFVAVNRNRVQLNALALFHANIAAKDQDHLDLAQLLRECKITVPRNPAMNGETGPREIQCVGTLLRLMH